MPRKRFGFLFWQIIVHYRKKKKSFTVNKEARNLILRLLQERQAPQEDCIFTWSRPEMFKFWSATECFDTAFFMIGLTWLWTLSCSLWSKTVRSWKLPWNRMCILPAALPVIDMIISMLHTGWNKAGRWKDKPPLYIFLQTFVLTYPHLYPLHPLVTISYCTISYHTVSVCGF